MPMVTGGGGVGLGRRVPRVFAGPADEPRARRASDLIALGASLLVLAALATAAVPPSRFELALQRFLAGLPVFLDSLWTLLAYLPWLGAGLVLVAALVRRRTSLVRDLIVAAALAIAIVLVGSRVVEGDWASIDAIVGVGAWPFPAAPLAIAGAVLVAANPHVISPLRRLSTWLLWLAALSGVLLSASPPASSVAGLMVAIAGGAAVHLLFGSVRGRPGMDDITAALSELGVEARLLGPADRLAAGDFVIDAEDGHDLPLVVKVYGRDAHETQLVNSVWRRALYRESDSPTTLSRLHQVEHEALLTLLVGQAGVATYELVTAGAASNADALIVLRPVGRTLSDSSAEVWTPAAISMMWETIGRLHSAGITHGQLDGDRIFTVAEEGDSPPNTCGHRIGLADLGRARVGTDSIPRRRDEAQLFVTSVLGAGEGQAIAAAEAALGLDGIAAMLPFVQMPVLTPVQRRAVRAADLDLDDLREHAAARVGLTAPDLQQLRRVTVGSLLQTTLLVLAFLALSRVVGGVDFTLLGVEVADANWWLAAIGFVLAQVPRLAHAISSLGASPVPLALGPVYVLQLATGYVNLVVPSAAGRIAINVRFLQRQGLRRGTALAVGALDSFAGFIVQIVLLAGLLSLTSATLDLDLDVGSAGGVSSWLVVIAVLGVAGVTAVVAVPAWRHRALDEMSRLWAEAGEAIRGLSSPRRLGMLFGGSLAHDFLLALALGVFVRSLGYSVGLGELVVIVVSVSLLAGIMPIPGGIGVTEGGLIFGLVAAGIPEEAAFAAVVLYRLASFYLPPVWGYFSMRWLERNSYI